MNSAASRLLGLDARTSPGCLRPAVFGSPELKPLAVLIDEATRSRDDALPQEVTIARDGRELHLAVMTTPLAPRGRRLGRRRARLRRRDAAHSRAEGGGVARGRAAAGARDQEPAHADSTVAPSASVGTSPRRRRRRAISSRSARRPSSAKSSRSRGSSTSSRSLRGCRLRGPSRPTCTRCSTDVLALYPGISGDVELRRSVRRQRCRRCRSTPSRSAG